jgi:hypothetical protein
VLQRELGGPGWRFLADRSSALHLPVGHGGVDEGFALEFSGPNGRHALTLWFANEQPPSGNNPFAAVEPGTPERTVTVRLRLRDAATIVQMLGHRSSAPRTRTGAVRLSVGQDPIYVVWRSR